MSGAPVTLLFTDLVDSTGLLRRVGDERAQRILHAHRQLTARTLARGLDLLGIAAPDQL